MPFTWNVLTKNLRADQALLTKLRQRIGELEPFIRQHPARSVHLLIRLEREPNRERVMATLTLRLPRNILRSQEAADEVMKAFEDAVRNLARQLQAQKPDTRGERFPKAARAGRALQQTTRFDYHPQPGAIGPQSYEDLVRDFFAHNYERLLNHVRRHIEQYEATGELPQGAVDPHDIVDEVARQAEAKANEGPPTVSWLVWMFHLMHQELQRQRDYYKQKETGDIPTEKPVKAPELSEKKLHPLEQIVQKKMEPQIIRAEDVVPSSEMRPDEFVAQKERLEQMLPELPRWPWIEREVFELYFIEGFEPDEIAQAMGQPLEKIQKIVDTLRARVREQLLDPEEVPA